MTPRSVLIVEDEAITALELEACVVSLGHTVCGTASTGEAALQLAERHLPALALMDIRLQGPLDGVATALELRRRFGVASIFLTAHGDAETLRRARPTLAEGWVAKPFRPEDVKRVMELTLARRDGLHDEAQGLRLGALKVLAGGVAHEVNNPLAALVGNLDWARRGLEGLARGAPLEGEALTELLTSLDESREAAARIAGVVADLTTFASGRVRGSSSAEAVARWAAQVTEPFWKPRAQLVVHVSPDVCVPLEDRALSLVLVQLITNAAQAIGPHGDPARDVIVVSGATGADGPSLEVRDTGEGASDDVLERAFEPYFTTRPFGAGRGLGLSLCQGTVAAVGGRLVLERAEGQGCRVRLSFPPLAESP